MGKGILSLNWIAGLSNFQAIHFMDDTDVGHVLQGPKHWSLSCADPLLTADTSTCTVWPWTQPLLPGLCSTVSPPSGAGIGSRRWEGELRATRGATAQEDPGAATQRLISSTRPQAASWTALPLLFSTSPATQPCAAWASCDEPSCAGSTLCQKYTAARIQEPQALESRHRLAWQEGLFVAYLSPPEGDGTALSAAQTRPSCRPASAHPFPLTRACQYCLWPGTRRVHPGQSWTHISWAKGWDSSSS